MASSIVVDLVDVPPRLARGEFLVPTVRVRNDGSEPTTVNARLNLLEGDLLVRCTTPDDDRIQLQGRVTIDSFPREVELAPGERLQAGIFLTYTSNGFAFETPGPYRLSTEYDPGGRRGPIESDAVELQVVEPTSDEGRRLASLTTDDAVGRAIALAGLDDPDPEVTRRLETVADGFPDRREGAIARLTLAVADDDQAVDVVGDLLGRWEPMTVARWITALSVPATDSDPLVAAFLSSLEADSTDRRGVEPARRTVRGEPVD